MATKYRDWPDGKAHSIPYAQHLINMRNAAGNPMTLPPPPVGTYDSAIDYNAGAAQRGYDQFAGDAQTLFERGQQDYGVNLGDLTRGRDRNLADLLTSDQRIGQDYQNATNMNRYRYGILGNRQSEAAARQGVQSAGLLAKSKATRDANESRENTALKLAADRGFADNATARARVGENFDRGKLGLDLGNAREFGGFNGQSMINPLTGKPEFGSLLTSLTRAGGENVAYQTEAAGQRARQAAAGGYVSPLTQNTQTGGTVSIGNTPMTGQMWQNGLFLDALRKAGYNV